MKAQLYNNPLLAQGLAELVDAFVGNPMRDAQAKQMMESARLTGLRADQLEQELAGTLAGTVAAGVRGSSPRATGGAGGAGTTSDPAATTFTRDLEGLTQTEQNRVLRLINEAGYEGVDAATVLDSALTEYTTNPGTLDQIVLDVLQRADREEYEVEPGEKRERFGIDWLARDKAPVMGERVVIAPREAPAADVGQPDTDAVIAEARAAIAAGADRNAVIARLKQMGISTEGL